MSWLSYGVINDKIKNSTHQGPAVETATMVMVVEHVRRPHVEPVHCWRPRFTDCHCTSLEHCAAERSVIQFSVNFQASDED